MSEWKEFTGGAQMTAQTIEVEGLPEGYKVIDAHVTSSIKGTNSNGTTQVFASITVEKIQPRRIVLEETEEFHEPEDINEEHTQCFPLIPHGVVKVISNKKWREVKENKEEL